jgi:hypothetical protein
VKPSERRRKSALRFLATRAMTIATVTPAKSRPVFVLKLRPEPGVDPILALRALLKVALRRFGLRCTSASQANIKERTVRRDPTDAKTRGLAVCNPRQATEPKKVISQSRTHRCESADAAMHPKLKGN